MKSFFTGTIAAIIGAIGLIFLFFRKGGASIEVSSRASALDKKVEAVKAEVKALDEKIGKPVEEKSLESELEYWNKEKK